MRTILPLALGMAACAPAANTPSVIDEHDRYPYVHAQETGLEDYETVRWETETWGFSDQPEFGLYLRKTQLHKKGSDADTVAHAEQMMDKIPAVVESDLRLSFVGDIMWIRDNWTTYADGVTDLIDGDLRVGNLETPTDPDQPDHADLPDLNTFNSPVELIDGSPVDLFQVTNNHTIDIGDQGVEHTMAEIEARGRQHTGVDSQAVIDVDGTTIAFLAYTWGLNQRPAVTTHDAHVIPFGHLDEDIDLGRVSDDLDAAREAGATRFVVLVHWGYEYEYYADPHFLQLGHDLVRLGADAVVGSGPHVVQPAEICAVNDPNAVPDVGACAITTDDGAPRTAAILYSLGDFAATPSLVTVPTKVGIVGTLSLDTTGVSGVGWTPMASLNDGSGQTLVPLETVTDPVYIAESERLDGLLGVGWKRVANVR